MKKFSVDQKFEISRLCDERYCVLQLRLERLKPLYKRNSSLYLEVLNELELLDSIFKVLSL